MPSELKLLQTFALALSFIFHDNASYVIIPERNLFRYTVPGRPEDFAHTVHGYAD